MSSKENKKMAQQRRAKEREAAEKKLKFQRFLIGAAIIVGLALVVILPGFFGGTVGEEDTEETAGEEEDTTEEADTSEDSEEAGESDTETADASSEDAEEERKLDKTEGREVKDGDTVNIDYTGYKDGEPFDGGSTNGAGADLEIGSHSYIDGFESGLIGKKVGETVDLNLTFPEDYAAEDLAGQDVVFNVTINGIYD